MQALSKIKLRTQLFINGEFVDAKKGKTFQVINPANEQVIARVQEATEEDVDLAVDAARAAYESGPWPDMLPIQRAALINKLADLVDKNADELARLQSWNNGKPYMFAKMVDLPAVSKALRYNAGWVDKIRGQVIPANGPYLIYTVKEPVGVVAQVIPWNFPLMMLSWKIAPALATGCTVVLKTAEQTPLSALKFAELIQQAKIPKGVINIISGHGQTGAYLVAHKKIDKVAFTGSTAVGYHIMRNCHKDNLKRVTLQLGGKSPHIVTENADLAKAIATTCNGLFFNSGQCCNAGSRVYVHEKVYDHYVKALVEATKTLTVGDPFEATTVQGPVVSKQQFDTVTGYIKSGIQQGAKLLVGGKRIGTKGYFIEPTVFVDATDDMRIVKQEIFGPVMVVMKYKTDEQVLHRSNNHRYGLACGIITENFEQGNYFARKIRAGHVYINAYHVMDAHTPFGGFKDSGIGRQLGEEGLNSYLETKTVSILRQQPPKPRL